MPIPRAASLLKGGVQTKAALTIDVSGLNETVAAIAEIGDEKTAKARLRTAMTSSAKPILERMKTEAPKGRGKSGGTLRRSLTISTRINRGGNLSVRVGPDSQYIEIVSDFSNFDKETKTGTIGFGRIKMPAKYAHLVEYGTKFTHKKTPFVENTFKAVGGQKYIDEVKLKLKKAYNRIARKHGLPVKN